MASWQCKVLCWVMRGLRGTVRLVNFQDVKKTRALFANVAKFCKISSTIKINKFKIGNMPAVWVVPSEPTDKVIFYLHGGAYLIGSIDSYLHLLAQIAEASGARVFAIDYRLAPEHPFPAALDDAKNAYLWLLTENIPPKNLIVMGDSAGGGLALALTIALRDENLAMPSAVVCMSPWVDLALTGETMITKAKSDPIVSRELAEKAVKFYLKNMDEKLPLASPLYADLKGLPSLMIQVGTLEILLSDAQRLADKAKMSGAQVDLDIWENMPHVWQFFAGFVPEGKEAIQRIGHFIRNS